MDTSLISAFFAATVGQVQLAAAARLAQTDAQNGSASSVNRLVAAAEQNFAPLAGAAAGLGGNLDITV